RCSGTYSGQGGFVGGETTDHKRHIEVVDELLEVERFGTAGDVLGRDRSAPDHEDVHTGVDDRPVVLGGALGGQPCGRDQTGAADLLDPASDQFFLDRSGVDFLEALGGRLVLEFTDFLEQRLRVFVPGPEPLQVQHSQA